MAKVHRGEVLRLMVRSHSNTGKSIALNAGYEPGTIYKHYKQKDLPYEIIMKYGISMKHDISIEFPEIVNEVSYENFKQKLNKINSQDTLDSNNTWKDKYHGLLEKHNEILMQNMKLKEEISSLEKELISLKKKK